MRLGDLFLIPERVRGVVGDEVVAGSCFFRQTCVCTLDHGDLCRIPVFIEYIRGERKGLAGSVGRKNECRDSLFVTLLVRLPFRNRTLEAHPGNRVLSPLWAVGGISSHRTHDSAANAVYG